MNTATTMTTYLQEEIDLDDKPMNTNVRVCYNKTSHPDMLTEKELESVTTVFRSFESGLREATIYPSVSRIYSNTCHCVILCRTCTRLCVCWASTLPSRRWWIFLMRLPGER